jgi:NADH-quinone oxidoreductase subunit N
MTRESIVGVEDFVAITPLLILFFASLIPLTLKVLRKNREMSSLSASLYAAIGPIGGIAAAILFFGVNRSEPFYAFRSALVMDGLSIMSTLLISIITLFSIFICREHKAIVGKQYSEFLFLLLNSVVGMLIIAYSNDLIVTFIGIEIMSLCLYLIIAMSNEDKLSKEAAFKYFVLGSFASAILLFGIAYIYGVTGTTYLDKLTLIAAQTVVSQPLFLLGLVLAIVGFCFKVALIPFHAWTPDVYEGAPTPVTGFMATAVKAVTFVAFIRLLGGYYLDKMASGDMVTALQWLAVLTIVLGNAAAVMQSSLKRMLAYSSIAHSGYIMMGLLAASIGGDGFNGGAGVIFYTVAYSIMTLGAFAVVTVLEHKENDIVLVEELRGLSHRSPWLAAMFSLFLLSLAGIPPTIGFFGKVMLFSSAIAQDMVWLVFWAAIGSVVSVYYYLRPLVLMYMKDEEGVTPSGDYRFSYAVIMILGVCVVAGGLGTEYILELVRKAVVSFF